MLITVKHSLVLNVCFPCVSHFLFLPLPLSQGGVKKGRMEVGASSPEGQTAESNSLREPEPGSQTARPDSQSVEPEGPGEGTESEGAGLLMEGYFSQHCDSASLSSFLLDTPSLARRPPPQEDTASLVSTGTLVPEAIYLPPPGHRLVTHSDWDTLNAQVNKHTSDKGTYTHTHSHTQI